MKIRLTAQEKSALKKTFGDILAPIGDVQVYLFGSRVDCNKKGGDIDLLISCRSTLHEPKTKLSRKLRIAIHDRIGEQKLDIVWDEIGMPGASLSKIAKSEGVLLWKSQKKRD